MPNSKCFVKLFSFQIIKWLIKPSLGTFSQTSKITKLFFTSDPLLAVCALSICLWICRDSNNYILSLVAHKFSSCNLRYSAYDRSLATGHGVFRRFQSHEHFLKNVIKMSPPMFWVILILFSTQRLCCCSVAGTWLLAFSSPLTYCSERRLCFQTISKGWCLKSQDNRFFWNQAGHPAAKVIRH